MNVGYRVLIDDKVIMARHIDVIEEDTRCIGFEDTEDKERGIENGNERKGENDTEEEVEETDKTEDKEEIQLRKFILINQKGFIRIILKFIDCIRFYIG